jgi:hypothetical protein
VAWATQNDLTYAAAIGSVILVHSHNCSAAICCLAGGDQIMPVKKESLTSFALLLLFGLPIAHAQSPVPPSPSPTTPPTTSAPTPPQGTSPAQPLPTAPAPIPAQQATMQTPAQQAPIATPQEDVPPPRTGFQMAFRTGYAVPLGEADSGESMGDLFSGQVPFHLEIGGKTSPWVFLGGYLTVGIGGVDGRTQSICSQGLSCATATVRAGFEIIGYATPAGKMTPWFGYGIGFESTAIALSGPGGDATISASGPEFARLMSGIDFRFSKGFGGGFFVDLSLAQYTHMEVTGPGVSRSQDVANKAFHEWLALGVRGVVFP